MTDRASKYAAVKRASSMKPSGAPILIAYVSRTAKGKVRLRRVAIRFQGGKEEVVAPVPQDDARFAFENDYKVRKAAHDLVKKSPKFSRFYDASTRVSYNE